MSVAISWAKKVQLAKCDISVSFPKFSHILGKNGGHRPSSLGSRSIVVVSERVRQNASSF